MAEFSSQVNIATPSGTAAAPHYQRSFYHFNTTVTTPLYIHMKTNIPVSSNIMFFIEADGYNYGNSAPILCSWTGYPYSGTGTLISTQVTNQYTGLEANGLYQSADNYVCIRAKGPTSLYYAGFILNAVMANPAGLGYLVTILAAIQNSTAGNHY